MYTEEEARQIQCCGGSTCGYTDSRYEGYRYCVASRCMAWRWACPEREIRRNYRDDLSSIQSAPGEAHRYPDGWQYEYTDNDRGRVFDLLHRLKPNGKKIGYCGKAGKP